MDELQKKYVCKESQQLTNARELIRELEKEKGEHDVELKLLKREVEKGIRGRESLEGTIEIKEKRLEGLERYGNKMDEL